MNNQVSRKTKLALLGLPISQRTLANGETHFYTKSRTPDAPWRNMNSRQGRVIEAHRIRELGLFKPRYEASQTRQVPNQINFHGDNELIQNHLTVIDVKELFNDFEYDSLTEILDEVNERFHKLLSTMAYSTYNEQNHIPQDKVRFRFYSRNVMAGGGRNTGFTNTLMEFQNVDIDGMVEKIISMLQSNEELARDDSLYIVIDTFRNIGGNCSDIELPQWMLNKFAGGGSIGANHRIVDTKKEKRSKMCLETALAYCLYWKAGKKIEIKRRGFWDITRELNMMLGLDDIEQPRTMAHVKKLEKALKTRITVFERINNRVATHYTGDMKLTSENPHENFYLLLHTNTINNKGHYFPIRGDRVGNIFPNHENHKKWCHYCLREDVNHKCESEEYCYCGLKKGHPKIKYVDEDGNEIKKQCEICKKEFWDKVCYDNHKKKRGACRRYCVKCGVETRKSGHRCGYSKCRSCGEYVHVRTHECYMEPVEERDYTFNRLYYDMESEFVTGGEKTYHRTNLVVAELIHDKTYMVNDGGGLEKRDSKPIPEHLRVNLVEENEEMERYKFVFHYTEHGDNVLDAFCSFVFNNLEETTIIAHNQKGYDGQFIVSWCFEENMKDKNFQVPTRIYNGGNVMYIHYKPANLRFVDSLCFCTQSLKSLPKTFGLDVSCSKGDYPIFFNTKENRNYVGEMPAIHYFPLTFKKEKEEKEFIEWYNERKKQPFNQVEELLKYCEQDVVVLRTSMEKFRSGVISETETDPFSCITLAGLVLQIVRSQYLKKEQIPLYKHNRDANTSAKANAWLVYLERTKNINIQYALNNNGCEEVVEGKSGQKYKVDGLLTDEEHFFLEKKVFQFHGCYWHGCPKCTSHKAGEINPTRKISYCKLYESTMRIEKDIRDAGYEVEVIWECEFDQLKLPKAEYERFFYTKKLNPYDAFAGGRTNVITPYIDLKKRGLVAHYDDIVSLYPTCNYYDEYPISLPERFSANRLPEEQKIEEMIKKDKYKGLILAKVLPPEKLYHPVLGIKHEGKYIFPLCNECMRINTRAIDSTCSHKGLNHIHKRAITGTWTTFEVKKALSLGYQLVAVYELWHFPKWSRGFMRPYIEKFLKKKICNADYDDKSPEFMEAYRNRLNEKYGWDLVEEDFENNPAMKQIAKLFLNTLWGKFCQAPNLKRNKVIKTRAEYAHFLFGSYDDLDLLHAQDNLIEIEYRQPEALMKLDPNVSIYIGIFTTSFARLRLYEALEYWGENVMYFDTDSVIYHLDQNNPDDVDRFKRWRETKCGKDLGEWESEFHDNEYITDFVSIGAKKYAYETNTGKKISKFAGIPINLNTCADQLSILKMRGYIMGERGTYHDPTKINKDKRAKTVFSRPLTKILRFTSDKRVVKRHRNGDMTTKPFGY